MSLGVCSARRSVKRWTPPLHCRSTSLEPWFLGRAVRFGIQTCGSAVQGASPRRIHKFDSPELALARRIHKSGSPKLASARRIHKSGTGSQGLMDPHCGRAQITTDPDCWSHTARSTEADPPDDKQGGSSPVPPGLGHLDADDLHPAVPSYSHADGFGPL